MRRGDLFRASLRKESRYEENRHAYTPSRRVRVDQPKSGRGRSLNYWNMLLNTTAPVFVDNSGVAFLVVLGRYVFFECPLRDFVNLRIGGKQCIYPAGHG